MPLTRIEKRLLGMCIQYIDKRGRSPRMNILKYLPLILKFKNISAVYQEETGQGKPFYMSRRFIGLVITVIFAIVTIWTGVAVGDAISFQIVHNMRAVVRGLLHLA